MSDAQVQPSLSTICAAEVTDIATLVEIEQACFTTDKLSVRSFRRFISEKRSDLYIARYKNEIVGYYLLLYRRGTSLARLYSIALLPSARGTGIAAQLLKDAEERALERHCAFMRLEVRPDNAAAIRLYQKQGYHPFGVKLDFYEDHTDALCMQKQIHHFPAIPHERLVPYISQSTPFTCGPACLLMAFNYFKPDHYTPEHLEIDIWREATTVFMTSGHGGCGPYGLALAAERREFASKIFVNQAGPLFLDTVRSVDKKAVMGRVYHADLNKVVAASIPIAIVEPNLALIQQLLAENYILLVLISTWQFDRSKAPHWVVVCAIDEYFVYINDPDVADIPWLSNSERQYIPISHAVFQKAFGFGKKRLKAIVAIKSR